MNTERPWHALAVDETFRALESQEAGLTEAEARRRHQEQGPNRLTARGGTPWWRKLLDQFVQPLVLVLIVASVVSLILGDVVDAIVIGAVVVINALIGFVQEHRAEQAIAALDRMVVTEATVVRDGRRTRVPSEQLVVGDIVLLQSGDRVPADLRLVSVRDLQVEEAPLTGESVPAAKKLDVLAPETLLGDRTNMAFAGTSVTYGKGTGVVVAIGDATATGNIAGLLATAQELDTPLTRRIAQLSKLLVWIILAVAFAMFGVEAALGKDLARTFNAAVALAVGAIPEGLPAAVTILLAVGVSSMAKRCALIRRLPAVETLGSTTVICSDKTGTLTQNQMTVTTFLVGQQVIEVSGVGYQPNGGFTREGAGVEPAQEPALREALLAGALCSDARVVPVEDGFKVDGDPTEAALNVVAEKAGFDAAALARFERLDAVPFESQHMYMATLHRAPDGCVMYVKGSSEVLIARCRTMLDARGREVDLDPTALEDAVAGLAARGMRVLCVARKRMHDAQTSLSHEDVRDLTLLGLVGMIDPPREEAKRAVSECQRAGIKVKMITGDHAVTASAIAEELGLEGARGADGRLRALTGQELDQISDEALTQLAYDVAVFARVAPEQKLRLVKALERRGEVVAMTGDGVNDAPALKQADIGVAMGQNGTDVARSAAAMILTDDNFATIAAAVEEGRGVYDNLVKFIAWTLPTNGGEGFVLLAAIFLGSELPILPVQLLWINMITAVLLGVALVFEPKEPGLMVRPPRPPDEPIMNKSLGIRTVLVSVSMATAAFVFFEAAMAQGRPIEEARTLAINTVVLVEVAYLFSCRSLRFPVWRIGWFSNPWVWYGALAMLAAQLVFTYVPFMNEVFHTAPLDAIWWAYLMGAGAVVFLSVELRKVVRFKSASGPKTKGSARVPQHALRR